MATPDASRLNSAAIVELQRQLLLEENEQKGANLLNEQNNGLNNGLNSYSIKRNEEPTKENIPAHVDVSVLGGKVSSRIKG
jgi:hypothetical protein